MSPYSRLLEGERGIVDAIAKPDGRDLALLAVPSVSHPERAWSLDGIELVGKMAEGHWPIIHVVRGLIRYLAVSLTVLDEYQEYWPRERGFKAWPTSIFCPARQNLNAEVEGATSEVHLRLHWSVVPPGIERAWHEKNAIPMEKR